MPAIVNSDQNRKIIGLLGDKIAVETGYEIVGFVTADTQIHKLKIRIGMIFRDNFGGIFRIARPRSCLSS